MKRLLPFLLLCLALACGGSGGSGGGSSSGGSQSHAPIISNFTLNPSSAAQNEGYGSIDAILAFDFSDPDGDVAAVLVTIGSLTTEYSIQDVSGLTEGYLWGSESLSTAELGSTRCEVVLIDSQNQHSNSLSAMFQVVPTSPVLASINPQSKIAGGPAFTLTVSGTGFFPDSTVLWNGEARSTTYVSATQLQAAITSQDIASPRSVPVTVLNPASEGGASNNSMTFSVSNLSTLVADLPANDIAWDSTRSLIYASLPSTAGSMGNSIAVIDPATGTVTTSVFAGSEPNRLAISGDNQYLYVGLDGSATIKRFALPDLSSDLSIPLGTGTFGPHYAADIQVAPGTPRTLAVSLGCKGVSPSFDGLAIFDDAVPRAGTISGFAGTGHLMNSIQWGADSSTLYASNCESTGYDYYILSVTAGGVSLVSEVNYAVGGPIHFDSATSLVYADSGQVLNPGTGSLTGTYSTYGVMVPDAARNRVYFCAESPSGYSFDLKSFDLSHFTPVATGKVNFIRSQFIWPYRPSRILRCGQYGLVFGGNGQAVYIVNGPFVSQQ